MTEYCIATPTEATATFQNANVELVKVDLNGKVIINWIAVEKASQVGDRSFLTILAITLKAVRDRTYEEVK